MHTGAADLNPMLIVATLVFAYSILARRLGHWHLTAPIVFVAGGVLWATLASLQTESLEWLKSLAEITLALVLFADAAGVKPRQIQRERGLVMRLLFLGLPLTIILGTLVAAWAFPTIPFMMALLLGSLLAPTDAALGAATVTDKRIPVRVRRVLNVESGLNDGLATPVVLFAIAAIAGEEGLSAGNSAVSAVVEIVLGVAVGAVVGLVGGWLVRLARDGKWAGAKSANIAVLSLPIVAYLAAGDFHGNGFIAAFVAGSVYGAAARTSGDDESLLLTETLTEPLGYATWLAFGALVVPVLLDDFHWMELVYAILSLTALRMVPVALSLLGSGLRLRTVAFIGWFGPRGLASVVFTLIALETLELDTALHTALDTATLTILLSVVLHGISAGPWAARYGAWVGRVQPAAETQSAPSPRTRGPLSGDRPAVPSGN